MIRTTLFAFAATVLIAGSATAATSGRKFTTSLKGSAETPAGDTDGSGRATITVNSGQRKVCSTLSSSKLDKATMAHIHSGKVGVSGPPVVTLKVMASGSGSGCVTVTRDLAMKLIKMPSDYYVNIHTTAFPDGAIRGQLAK